MPINCSFLETTLSFMNKDVISTKSSSSLMSHSWNTAIMSEKLKTILVTLNVVVLTCIISFLGIALNVINIVVFSKQGFQETVNISFTALAISDMCSLITSFGLSIFWNPMLLNSELPVVFVELQAPIGSWPHGCFCRITGWITAFITIERCICVTLPLKVRTILTARVTVLVMIFIYVLMLLSLVPLYVTTSIKEKFYPEANKTRISVFTTSNGLVYDIVFMSQAVTQSTSFVAVIIFSIILVVSLKNKSKWRNETTSGDQKSAKKTSKRQKKTVKMVTVIAASYVICYLPAILFLSILVFVSGFNPIGQYRNIFFTSWSFVTLFEVINSASTTLVYYSMSSKFKKSADDIFEKSLFCE